MFSKTFWNKILSIPDITFKVFATSFSNGFRVHVRFSKRCSEHSQKGCRSLSSRGPKHASERFCVPKHVRLHFSTFYLPQHTTKQFFNYRHSHYLEISQLNKFEIKHVENISKPIRTCLNLAHIASGFPGNAGYLQLAV